MEQNEIRELAHLTYIADLYTVTVKSSQAPCAFHMLKHIKDAGRRHGRRTCRKLMSVAISKRFFLGSGSLVENRNIIHNDVLCIRC